MSPGLTLQDLRVFLEVFAACWGGALLLLRGAPGDESSRRRLLDRTALAAAVVAYLCLALRHLRIPTLDPDETQDVIQALYLLKPDPALAAELPDHFIIGRLPLMAMSYVGCPTSYLLAPLIRLFGLSVVLLRVTAIALSLAAGGILLSLVSEAFVGVPLWVPALVVGLNSIVLAASREGLYVCASLHWLLLALTLRFLWRWTRTRRAAYAFACFFTVGFGIYSKIIFVWFFFAAAGCFLWLRRRDARDPAEARRFWGSCALGLVLGLLPLIVYNAASGFETAKLILQSLDVPALSSEVASNGHIFRNLLERLGHLAQFFYGDLFIPTFRSRYFLGLADLALVLAGFAVFRAPRERGAYSVAALFAGVFLFGSIFTVSSRSVYHLVPLYPLLLVMAGVTLARLIPQRPLTLLAVCLVLQWPQWVHYGTFLSQHSELDIGANEPQALSRLSDFLLAHDIRRPWALGWGMDGPLLVESGGRVLTRGFWRDNEDLLSLPDGAVVVCYTQPDAPRPERPGCTRLLTEKRLSVRVLSSITSDRGFPWYTVVRVAHRDTLAAAASRGRRL